MRKVKYRYLYFILIFFLFGCPEPPQEEEENKKTQTDSGPDNLDPTPEPEPEPTQENNAPTAENITKTYSADEVALSIQLSAKDHEGDSLSYELLSPQESQNYKDAYLNETSGVLYLSVLDTNNSIDLQYRVTDGLLFSQEASVKINFEKNGSNENTGLTSVNPEDYSGFDIAYINGSLEGVVNGDPIFAEKIDLSTHFPPAGSQGSQGSCVGWAVAYSLKSYQEKLDQNWTLNTYNHIFSPAYIYNQINRGLDKGSLIYEALQLVVDQGVSTYSTMPYREYDYLTQPDFLAQIQASEFKAKRWATIRGIESTKAALANRLPVVIGMQVTSSFYFLNAINSVFQPVDEEFLGGHAVTIVGYDDNKYGGAFKVMNSWGQDWGDRGFFWIPFSTASSIISEAYILEDISNDYSVSTIDTYVNKSKKPNLVVNDWYVNYNSTVKGSGHLEFEIGNTGIVDSPSGVSLCLMLSEDNIPSHDDYYVICETIDFPIKSNYVVYRDSSNRIPFQFPDHIKAGSYYMYVWVDDFNIVEEQNEDDNWAFGKNTITLRDTLPDLVINSWYASWNSLGLGKLQYNIINLGPGYISNTNWYINLMLSSDFKIDQNDYFLFFEKAGYPLNFGQYIYRDFYSSATFSLSQDYFGRAIPDGVYIMALWIDDTNLISESNEINNISYSWDFVNTYKVLTRSDSDKKISEAYNGRSMEDVKNMKVVEIKDNLIRSIGNFNHLDHSAIDKLNFDHELSSKSSIFHPFKGRQSID